jgi:hypothetical protein
VAPLGLRLSYEHNVLFHARLWFFCVILEEVTIFRMSGVGTCDKISGLYIPSESLLGTPKDGARIPVYFFVLSIFRTISYSNCASGEVNIHGYSIVGKCPFVSEIAKKSPRPSFIRLVSYVTLSAHQIYYVVKREYYCEYSTHPTPGHTSLFPSRVKDYSCSRKEDSQPH